MWHKERGFDHLNYYPSGIADRVKEGDALGLIGIDDFTRLVHDFDPATRGAEHQIRFKGVTGRASAEIQCRFKGVAA
jgi:hypothetical protein